MDLADKQSTISLKKGDEGNIPPGTYTYESAMLYYVAQSDLRLQVNDTKQKDGSMKATFGCVRNAKNDLHPFNVEAVRSLVVTSSHKISSLEVMNFTVGTDASKFKAEAKVDPNKKLESPGEAYENKALEFFMVTTEGNESDYEIRSRGDTGFGTYILQIKLKRTPPPN